MAKLAGKIMGARRWMLCAAAAACLALPASAQQRNSDPAPVAVPAASVERAAAPKLLIVISVDQFSADLFAQYRTQFRGGLDRLARGVVFPSAYQAHGATETCPGHSVILTGNYPAHTGIVANNWYDLSLTRDDRRVYCSEDPTIAGTSSRSGQYQTTTANLMVPTLGDYMKDANGAARVISIAGKDRAAIMMGGHHADEMWWLAPTGLASLPGRTPSEFVARLSSAVAANINTARPDLDVPAQCAALNHPVDIGGGKSVGTGHLGRDAGNFRGFMASPEADASVLAVGAAMQAQYHLGQGTGTDLLILGLSATDYVGHGYGPGGVEMCLQMAALDRELGDFFARMDATGVDYAVALTADHGGHDLPERNRENAIGDAARVAAGLSADDLSDRLKAELGMQGFSGPLLYSDGPFGDYYYARGLSAGDRARVETAVMRILRANPQVETVMTAAEIAAVPISTRSPELWTIAERLRASYYPGRSGDFLVVLKPRVTPITNPSNGYVATHGSVWDYDRRVPLLFWRRDMAGFEQPNPVRVADLAPTLAGLIGLSIDPARFDGHCLDLLSGPASSCPTR